MTSNSESLLKSMHEFLLNLTSYKLHCTKPRSMGFLCCRGSADWSNRTARLVWAAIPQPGEAIKIPAKTVVKFRVAKAAKDAIVPGGKTKK